MKTEDERGSGQMDGWTTERYSRKAKYQRMRSRAYTSAHTYLIPFWCTLQRLPLLSPATADVFTISWQSFVFFAKFDLLSTSVPPSPSSAKSNNNKSNILSAMLPWIVIHFNDYADSQYYQYYSPTYQLRPDGSFRIILPLTSLLYNVTTTICRTDQIGKMSLSNSPLSLTNLVIFITDYSRRSFYQWVSPIV